MELAGKAYSRGDLVLARERYEAVLADMGQAEDHERARANLAAVLLEAGEYADLMVLGKDLAALQDDGGDAALRAKIAARAARAAVYACSWEEAASFGEEDVAKTLEAMLGDVEAYKTRQASIGARATQAAVAGERGTACRAVYRAMRHGKWRSEAKDVEGGGGENSGWSAAMGDDAVARPVRGTQLVVDGRPLSLLFAEMGDARSLLTTVVDLVQTSDGLKVDPLPRLTLALHERDAAVMARNVFVLDCLLAAGRAAADGQERDVADAVTAAFLVWSNWRLPIWVDERLRAFATRLRDDGAAAAADWLEIDEESDAALRLACANWLAVAPATLEAKCPSYKDLCEEVDRRDIGMLEDDQSEQVAELETALQSFMRMDEAGFKRLQDNGILPEGSTLDSVLAEIRAKLVAARSAGGGESVPAFHRMMGKEATDLRLANGLPRWSMSLTVDLPDDGTPEPADEAGKVRPWLPNMTLFDCRGGECLVADAIVSPISFGIQVLTGLGPADEVVTRELTDDQQGMWLCKTLLDVRSPVRRLLVSAATALARSTPRFIVLAGTSGVDAAARLPSGLTFDRITTGSVADRTGPLPLWTSFHGRLADRGVLTSECLVTPMLYENLFHYLYSTSLVPTRNLLARLLAVDLVGGSIGERAVFRRTLAGQTRATKAEMRNFLLSLLVHICRPPRTRADRVSESCGLTLGAWFDTIAHMSTVVDFPVHWLAELVEALLDGEKDVTCMLPPRSAEGDVVFGEKQTKVSIDRRAHRQEFLALLLARWSSFRYPLPLNAACLDMLPGDLTTISLPRQMWKPLPKAEDRVDAVALAAQERAATEHAAMPIVGALVGPPDAVRNATSPYDVADTQVFTAVATDEEENVWSFVAGGDYVTGARALGHVVRFFSAADHAWMGDARTL